MSEVSLDAVENQVFTKYMFNVADGVQVAIPVPV